MRKIIFIVLSILVLVTGVIVYGQVANTIGGGHIKIDESTNTVTIDFNLLLDSDDYLLRDVDTGLTAGTTQTQGGGLALTAQVNDIETIENDNDTVVLPSLTSTGSLSVIVVNDDASGSNILQIFPASGDDLGAGINVATTLEANESIVFTGIDATEWHMVASTEISHSEMQDTDNTDAFVITAVTNIQGYHSNAFVAGDLSGGWTFDAGGAGTSFSITVIADAGGGNITVTTGAAHGLAVNDIVTQSNLTDAAYEGIFKVLTVPTTTTYTVTATFTATDTGTMDQPATLTASVLAVGTYLCSFAIAATSATNNEEFDFDLYFGTTRSGGGLAVRDKFGTANDFDASSGTGLVDIESGDKISFIVENQDTAGNITIRNIGITLIRL